MLNNHKALAEVEKMTDKGKTYQESILFTDNTRLAAVLSVFGAALLKNCPLEWIDLHKSRESFLRYLENPSDPKYQPRPKVTFNFEEGTVPAKEIVKAFGTDYEQLDTEFESLISELSEKEKKEIRNAVSRLIARACHEALLKREELVRLLKRFPHNSKFDQIIGGGTLVRMGKNSSSELRAHFLSKLPG